METEEVIKLVDGIYKNILDKFNPGARQLISAGKAYLKALHGAAAASRLFNEAMAKIAVNAQQGGTTDIGAALMNIVGVYKEIQDQHMNILKAFYVDLLVPLETNLEKDTKVVQFEQKKFMQQHKVRTDSYSKAAATMKKQRKKKPNSQNADKEIKSIQALEEEKNKLDAFCEQSLKNAMTQERRRYGFVLERQCSLAKHWMAYHAAGKGAIEESLDNWQDVAATREFLPPNVETMFTKRMKEAISEDDSDRESITSVLRKTRSIDASCLDMRSLGDVANSMNMPRAKSEFNLTSSTTVEPTNWDQRPVARSLYAYLSSGENQLSFLEGDRIALVGERAKGWQFGENLRTQMYGWFPLAYTEMEIEDLGNNWDSKGQRNDIQHDNTPDSSLESTLVDEPTRHSRNAYQQNDVSPTRMFGDTILYRQSKQFRGVSGGAPKPGPPPTLPAPVPTPVVPPHSKNHQLSQSHSFSSSGGPPMIDKRKSGASTTNFSKQATGNKVKSVRDGVTNASLHSSNDSGFANEPPPQPEVDYSDEDTVTRVPIRSSRSEKRYSPNTTTTTTTMRSTTHLHHMNGNSNTLQRSSNRNSENIRQSSSFGNLADDNTLEFLYRSGDPGAGGNFVKRTKSFWKFGKQEDIMEGMALWKHRDLVLTENERNEEMKTNDSTLKRKSKLSEKNGDYNYNNNMINNNNNNNNKNSINNNNNNNNTNNNNNDTLVRNGHSNRKDIPVIDDHAKYHITKSEIDQRINKHSENIYGIQTSTPPRQSSQQAAKGKSSRQSYNEMEAVEDVPVERRMNSYESRPEKYRNGQNINKSMGNGGPDYEPKMKYYDDHEDHMDDPNFYDDESVNDIVLKTVKRKEILKQYYSSGTDTERNSSSSDPYDCIVVEDHLVRKDKENNRDRKDKMEFRTFRGENKEEIIETTRAGTLLPRTKLSKAPSVGPIMQTVLKLEKEQEEREIAKRTKEEKRNAKAYGPWYDLWGQDTSVPK